MTTELARYAPNGIQTYQEPEEEDGSLGLSEGDVRPPWIRYNGQTGEITFTHDGTINESMDVVMLRKLPSTRVYFNPDDKAPKEQMILCRSNDFQRPIDVSQALKVGAGGEFGGSCGDCPLRLFTKDENGKNVRPACSEVLNLAVATVPETEDELPIPALMSFRSLSAVTMRAILSQLEIQHRTARQPAYAWRVQLMAGPRQKDGMRSWLPLAAKVLPERVDPDLLPAYSELWRLMRSTTIDVTTEAEMAVAPDADAAREPDDGSTERPFSGEELDAEIERREAEADLHPDDIAANEAAWESLQASEPPQKVDPDYVRKPRGRL